VNRLALLAAVALAALTTALPALADEGRSVKGVVAALSATSVSVKDAHRTLTCGLTANSPSLAGYAEGDRVQAQCRRAAKHFVLAKIRHLTAHGSGVTKTEPVKFGGTVTALSSDSISLHDGDHDFTCSLGDTSPSTDGLQVGDHAKVVCQDGALVSLERPGLAPPRPAVTTAGGTVTAVSADSLTLHNAEHGDLTCTVSSDSPSLAGVHVGDLVKVACTDGMLSALARSTAVQPPPPPRPLPVPQPLTTFAGTLTALSSTSLTVHNDEHGDVSCRVTDGSPHLGDYHLGDRVKLACADGVLKLITKL
jgi:hypothetical protein